MAESLDMLMSGGQASDPYVPTQFPLCTSFVGARMSTQINELLQKGVDSAIVAEAFNLDTSVVEEVQRVQAGNAGWILCTSKC